ncbi:MAG: DUF262 domain-containing HNH endonuclease family protein [Armatimonadetes bacterium]|nr:DUF262 domain-containing HNH endonuclease family protein [Armatimonadota bacterium]
MGGSFESCKYNFAGLLGKNERRSVVLPEFQRGFSWEKTQVSTFWTDFLDFHEGYCINPVSASYFLGPIVIQEADDEILLLDGQQRLATATILLAAVRDAARSIAEHYTAVKGSASDFARDLQRDLIEKEEGDHSYALRLSELDAPYFERTIQSDPPKTAPSRLRSHELIAATYTHFAKAIEVQTAGLEPEEVLARLKTYKNCLSKGMIVVAILVESEEDAYCIFETLNDRGLRLSVPDLLLNLLMRRCSGRTERNTVRQSWNTMLQQLARRDIAQFVRHMWLSNYGDLKTRGLFSEIKRVLTQKAVTSSDFAGICGDECQDYVSLLDIDDRIPRSARNDVSGLVKYLNVRPSLPLLLSGLRSLNESDFAKLAHLAAALAVRYLVVANLNPLDLETAFYAAAREIRGKKHTNERSAHCLAAAKAILAKLNPDDAMVAASAADLVLTRGRAQWLLAKLAGAKQSRSREFVPDRVNLEHIFPQRPGSAWPHRAALEPYTWHLGNLTILGEALNNKAANADFLGKCRYYAKSEVAMTNEIPVKYSAWTEKEILARAHDLAADIVAVWPGP